LPDTSSVASAPAPLCDIPSEYVKVTREFDEKLFCKLQEMKDTTRPLSSYYVVKGMVQAVCSSKKGEDPLPQRFDRAREFLKTCPEGSKITKAPTVQSGVYLTILGLCDPSFDFADDPETKDKVCGWRTYLESNWGESAKVITAELNKFRVNGL